MQSTKIPAKVSLLLAAFISGCATAIPMSYEEQCAMHNMKFAGISESEMRGTSMSFQPGTRPVFHRATSTSMRCDVTNQSDEQAKIDRLQQIAYPKAKYNSGIKGKQLATAIGYYLFVVPGILLKLHFDRQYDAAVAESEAIARQPAGDASRESDPVP